MNLTLNEKAFLWEFLENNGCAAETPEDLLNDNFSCQCVDDLEETINYTPNQIRGFLSSLIEKGVLWLEERDSLRIVNDTTLPHLYWMSEEVLKEMNPKLTFKENLLCNS